MQSRLIEIRYLKFHLVTTLGERKPPIRLIFAAFQFQNCQLTLPYL